MCGISAQLGKQPTHRLPLFHSAVYEHQGTLAGNEPLVVTAMTIAPPGVRFILAASPRAVIPPAVVLVAARIALLRGIQVSNWTIVFACILSLPVAFILSVKWQEYRNKRDAAALGAELPPTIEYKQPGGVDLIRDMRNDKEGRFPGASRKQVQYSKCAKPTQHIASLNGRRSTAPCAISAFTFKIGSVRFAYLTSSFGISHLSQIIVTEPEYIKVSNGRIISPVIPLLTMVTSH